MRYLWLKTKDEVEIISRKKFLRLNEVNYHSEHIGHKLVMISSDCIYISKYRSGITLTNKEITAINEYRKIK